MQISCRVQVEGGPIPPGYIWVGSAYKKGAYDLPKSDWEIPSSIKSYDPNPLKDVKTGRIKDQVTKEEAKQYKAWCETQAVVARRYESMLLRSRVLVAQLVPKLAGKVLLSWAKDDEVEWDHARILARYTNALLAKRIAIRETGPGTLPLTSYFTAPRT